MGRATILSKIATFILTGGRRTTASGTRDVLTEMANTYVSAIYDTAANFTSTNPVLETKQHGVETDNLTTSPKFKIGDGITAWNSLPYAGGSTLGYTPENVSNKSTNVITDQASNTKYPSVKAIYDWVTGLFVKKGTLTANTIPKATASDTIGNSQITDNGTTIEINSTNDGVTNGTDNFSYKTTSGAFRSGYYGATGYETTFDFYTNNTKNTSVNEFSGYYAVNTKNRFSIKNFTTGLAKLFIDMSTGYVGIGNDYTSPNERLEISNGNVRINDLTASQIVATDSNKNLQSLDVSTYPSLTELTYVKGATSALQTQLDGKLTAANNLSDLTNPLTARENTKQWNFFITGGNVTTTSNVASNITGFVTPTLTINKRYRMSGTIHTGCNNTGGVRLQVTLPTGCTISGFMVGSNVPNASQTAIYDISAGSTFVTSAFNQSNSQLGHVNFMIDVQMSTTAGTIQFGFASGTNTQTSTIYQLGTFGILEQLD